MPPDGGMTPLDRSVNENGSLVYATLEEPDPHRCVKSCTVLSFLISSITNIIYYYYSRKEFKPPQHKNVWNIVI